MQKMKFTATVELDLNEYAQELGYKALTELDYLVVKKMLSKQSVQDDLNEVLKDALFNECDGVFDKVLEWADDTEQQEKVVVDDEDDFCDTFFMDEDDDEWFESDENYY
jgi:hypothetical protein